MIGTRYRGIYRFACPTCHAKPGDYCRAKDHVGRMKRVEPHEARLKRMRKAQTPRHASDGSSVRAIPTFFEQGKTGRH